MYLKVNLCIVYLGLLYSCRSAKTIEVRLTPTDGLTKYFYSNFHSTNSVAPDSSQALIANKLDVDSFIITNFLHRPSEYYYFAWKEGKKDSASYKYSHQEFDGDDFETEHLPKLDAETLFFFGKKRNGKYVLIADENNNNSFDDDSVFIIDQPIIGNNKGESNLYPKATLANLFRYYKGQSIPFSTTIKLRPTVILDPASPQNSKLVLNFISDENFIVILNTSGNVIPSE